MPKSRSVGLFVCFTVDTVRFLPGWVGLTEEYGEWLRSSGEKLPRNGWKFYSALESLVGWAASASAPTQGVKAGSHWSGSFHNFQCLSMGIKQAWFSHTHVVALSCSPYRVLRKGSWQGRKLKESLSTRTRTWLGVQMEWTPWTINLEGWEGWITKGTRNLCGTWIFSVTWLWRWFHRCTHRSKVIKLHILIICKLCQWYPNKTI